jgi:hypothetical protein
MKKNLIRVLAVIMAVGMSALSIVAGITPVQAATIVGVSGEQSDIEQLVTTITVTGVVEDGVIVNAYQLVDGYYDNNNLVGYVLTDPANGKIVNMDSPTVDEIISIANNIGANNFEGQIIAMTKNDIGNYVADVEPGLYLILVSGASDTVFNPALVSVNVEDANDPVKIVAGEVSLTDFFEVGDTAAYIKSSKSDLDKKIVNTEGVDIGYGDTVAVGDDIYFKLDNMNIPSFSGDYEAPVYQISDTLEANVFDKITNIVVKVNGKVLPATVTEGEGDSAVTTTNYNLTQDSDTEFVISFSESYLRDHAADATRPSVEVTYQTKLLSTAGMNFAENHNNAKVEYSNDPTDATSVKVIDNKHTYHYTFAINGTLDGEAGDIIPDIINKIEYAIKGEDTVEQRYELAGATFTLYGAYDETNGLADELKNAVSDSEGRFLFDGLDEGTYYIKETAAPNGYALNNNIYKVVIEATLDDATGIMTNYTMTTTVKEMNSDEWKAAGSAKFTNTIIADAVAEDGSVTNNIATEVNTVDVVNSKIWQLPSTGGTGIALALGVSAILAITTGGLVMTAKRKSRK